MATHSSRVGSRNANTPPHEKKKISGGGGGRPRDLILLPRRLCVSCCSRHYIAFRGGVRTLRTFLKMVSANENVVVGGGGKKSTESGSTFTELAVN